MLYDDLSMRRLATVVVIQVDPRHSEFQPSQGTSTRETQTEYLVVSVFFVS